MSVFDDTLREIDNGILGYNKGVDFGLKKISNYIPNIQQKRFTTIAAGSGVGKTSLAIYMYIFCPYEAKIKDPSIDYHCTFYTMEIDKVSVMTKLIALKIFKDHTLVVDPDTLLSRREGFTLPEKIRDLVATYKVYFDRLEEIVEFIDEPINPTGASIKAQEVMMKCGHMVYFDHSGNPCTKELAYKSQYIPNNPKQIRVIMLDHTDCLRKEKDATTSKDKIDLFCEKAVYARNKYGTSWVALSQLNRGLDNAERQMHNNHKKNYELLLPQPADLKGTGNLYESSDIVLYGFSPHNYGIEEFKGYNTAKLQDRFRILGIMKNRYGASNIAAGYGYIGESSYFVDIPSPNDMKQEHYNELVNLK